jgi:hypothetical protein
MPGLVDNRGLQQAGIHKKNITTEIQERLDYVTAILVFANGTVPRGTGGLRSALSTLSTTLPENLANNIAFAFTNVANALSWNFCQDTIPDVLKSAPQFQIDNPVALQEKYTKLKNGPNIRKIKTEMRTVVEDGEQSALEMLVGLFDWLDALERQPTTTEVASLYEKSQSIKPRTTKLLAPMDQAGATKTKATSPNSALYALWQDVAGRPRPTPILKRSTKILGRRQ